FALALAPDGRTVAAGGENNILGLWDRATGKLVRRFVGHRGTERNTDKPGSVFSVAFSPTGETLASLSLEAGVVRVWDVATGKERFQLHGRALYTVRCLAFSPDGQVLAWADTDGKVRLSDAATGRLVREHQLKRQAVFSVAFSPDGKSLAAGV